MNAYRVKCLLVWLGGLLVAAGAFAQEPGRTYHLLQAMEEEIAMDSLTFEDSLTVERAVVQQLADWRQQGYLLASADQVLWEKDTLKVEYYRGPLYEGLNLYPAQAVRQLLPEINAESWDGSMWQWTFDEFRAFRRKLLTYAQDHGFPYAMVTLDSVQWQGQEIQAQVDYISGQAVVFDTLEVVSDGKLGVHKKFFHKYLGIDPGEVYAAKKVKEAANLIRGLPYLKLLRDPEVIFNGDKAIVRLHLEKVKASTVDGVMGFGSSADEDKKINLTGQFSLDLYNPLGKGKQLLLDWKHLQAGSQQLELAYGHPNLFNTRLDVGLDCMIQKEDSLYLKVERGMSVGFNTRQIGTFRVFTDWRDSWMTTELAEEQSEDLSDYAIKLYGIGWQHHRLDDWFVRRKGFWMSVDIAAGNLSYWEGGNEAEDSGTMKKERQLEGQADFREYIKLGKRATLMLREYVGGMSAGADNHRNNLFRVGGMNDLRGFDQSAFFVSGFAMFTAEYRLFFEETSFLYLFVDNAVLAESAADWRSPQPVLGTGAGVRLATKAGMFNFACALGKVAGQSLNTAQAKVHFGLVRRF